MSTALIAVTLFLIASTLAKTIKEATAYSMPFYIISMVISVSTMYMESIPTNISLYLIPIYNLSLGMKGILIGDLTTPYLLIIVMSNLLYFALGVLLMSKLFKSEKIMFTDMVYWNTETAKPVRAYTEPGVTTVRNSKILSRDIDNDGNIEIPVVTTLKGDAKQFSLTDYDNVYTFTLLNWLDAKGDNHKDNVQTLHNPLEGYMLKFNWNGTISIRYDSVQTALLFCEWNESQKAYGDELFSIAYRELKDDAPYGAVLYECDEGVYYYEITKDGTYYGITEDLLVSSFIKL
jgi:hypothetical protein